MNPGAWARPPLPLAPTHRWPRCARLSACLHSASSSGLRWLPASAMHGWPWGPWGSLGLGSVGVRGPWELAPRCPHSGRWLWHRNACGFGTSPQPAEHKVDVGQDYYFSIKTYRRVEGDEMGALGAPLAGGGTRDSRDPFLPGSSGTSLGCPKSWGRLGAGEPPSPRHPPTPLRVGSRPLSRAPLRRPPQPPVPAPGPVPVPARPPLSSAPRRPGSARPGPAPAGGALLPPGSSSATAPHRGSGRPGGGGGLGKVWEGPSPG